MLEFIGPILLSYLENFSQNIGKLIEDRIFKIQQKNTSFLLLSHFWTIHFLFWQHFDKFAALPDTFDTIFVNSVEFARTVQLIIYKSPFKELSIDQLQNTLAFFSIIEELSFILKPMIIDVGTVLVMVRAWNWGNLVVKNFAFSMEVVHFPLAFVSNFPIRVEKGPVTVHLVFEPLAVVLAAIDVKECAQTVSFVILVFSDILGAWWINNAPDFVLLRNRLDILFFWHFLSVVLRMVFTLFNENLASSWFVLWDKRFSHFASLVYCAQMMIMTIIWRLSFVLLYWGCLFLKFFLSYFRGLFCFLFLNILKFDLLFR